MNAIRLLFTVVLAVSAASSCNETGGTSAGAVSGAGASTGTGTPHKSDAGGNEGGSYDKSSSGW